MPQHHNDASGGGAAGAGPAVAAAVAIALWATLATLTLMTEPVPPMQLASMAFAFAFVGASLRWIIRGDRIVDHFRQPIVMWLAGVVGISANVTLYFAAMRGVRESHAGANLVNYLWPILIIVFCAIVFRQRLGVWQWLGMITSFAGAALAITAGGKVALESRHASSYLLALGGAACWAAYTVASRAFPRVPVDAVSAFGGVSAILIWCAHLCTETTVWPHGLTQWIVVAAIGFGPMGIAYQAWDHAIKRGDPRLVAAASFAIPVISTLLLMLVAHAPFHPRILVAGAMIALGAVLVSRNGTKTLPPPPTD